MSQISFDNTEIAFKHKSDAELKQAKWLFSMFNYNWMVKYGPGLTTFAMKIGLPVKGFIKKTIFRQFCGGENIKECGATANALHQRGVGSILDYSAEGVEEEDTFIKNVEEIKQTIRSANTDEKFPFAVFKCTGIGRLEIFEKASLGSLSEAEIIEFNRAVDRIKDICQTSVDHKVRLLIDAEESWIQDSIDDIALRMMGTHNRGEVWIYNTLQMYRVDRLPYLKETIALAKRDGFKMGYKLVRGAYMEKERKRAEEMTYTSPIQASKADTDRDFDLALEECFNQRDVVSTCLGTHNESSSGLLSELMSKNNIPVNDNRFWFAQLFGMSDNISFNLAERGYNVAKYLPYGPIKTVLPYLGRRAQENSSVSGQVGREMSLIVTELRRRRKK